MSEDQKMDPELKTKWLEALRGSKYKQAREALKDSCGFCCLGVLCDIVDPNGWKENIWRRNDDMHDDDDDIVYSDGELGRIMRQYVRISDTDETILISMNDGTNGNKLHSFIEIADYIEKHL